MHDLDNIAAVTASTNPPTSQSAVINSGGCKSCGEKRKFDEIRRTGGINGTTASIKATSLPFDKKYRVGYFNFYKPYVYSTKKSFIDSTAFSKYVINE